LPRRPKGKTQRDQRRKY